MLTFSSSSFVFVVVVVFFVGEGGESEPLYSRCVLWSSRAMSVYVTLCKVKVLTRAIRNLRRSQRPARKRA